MVSRLSARPSPSSLTELLIFRVQQAIAGAIALPNGMALLREIVPAERRASRIGLLGSGIVLAAAVGPPLGGVLIKLAGWRAVFSANLLIILPALVLAIKALPHLRASHQRRPFDRNGALLLLVILSSAAFLLTTSERQFLPAVATWGATGLLILLVFWFLRLEGAHDDPVFQRAVLSQRDIRRGQRRNGTQQPLHVHDFSGDSILLFW